MIDIAHKMLELFRRYERAAGRFAALVLAAPTDLCKATGQLPDMMRIACLRLIQELEYLAEL